MSENTSQRALGDGLRFVSERLRSRQENLMSTAGDLGLALDDVINLSLGDPDLTTDKRIIEASYRDSLAGHTHYTHTLGQEELREEICRFVRERQGLHYELDECMVTTSANVGMYLALYATLDPGDEVIILEPYYTPYPDQIAMAGGVAVMVPTPTDGPRAFLPRSQDIEAAITERTKAIIVNTPTNPTGVVYDDEALEAIAEVAIKHDLLVLADDIYTIYDFERPFRSIATIEGMAERTVVLFSFSKNYCMTGYRLGYMLAPCEFIAAVRDINENVVFTAPTPSQRAGLEALRRHDEVCAPIRETFLKRLCALAREVERTPHMSCATVHKPADGVARSVDKDTPGDANPGGSGDADAEGAGKALAEGAGDADAEGADKTLAEGAGDADAEGASGASNGGTTEIVPGVAGAIYLWIDIRETGLSSVEVSNLIYAEAHVATIAGVAFGPSGEGFIRLAATISEDRIHEAFERIRRMPLFSADS